VRRLRLVLVVVGGLIVVGTRWLDRDDPGPARRGSASAPVSTLPGPPRAFALDPFYRKYVDADGIPVVASERVSDRALFAAREVVLHMVHKRPDVRAHVVEGFVLVAVMAPDEQTLDIPEHADLGAFPTDTPGVGWNERARGLGATRIRPVTTCGEENLLCLPGDPYRGANILIHEFGHTIADIGLEYDRGFHRDLVSAYTAAMTHGLWKGTYSAKDEGEYWAEGVADWFDANLHDVNDHNEIHTRAQLRAYDPVLYDLLARVFDDDDWRYRCPEGSAPSAIRPGESRPVTRPAAGTAVRR
jgi:hypothetical protein